MTLTGNICAGLATVVIVLLFLAISSIKGANEMQWTTILLSIPAFLLFSGTFSAIAAAGKFDSLGWPRPGLHLGVWASCLSLTVLTCLSLMLRNEPSDQIPVGVRPFLGWGGIVIPVLLLAAAFALLNSPATWPRNVFLATAAIGLLAGVVMLGEMLYWSQKRQLDRIQAIQDRESDRDKTIMEDVQKADPEKDFLSLLNQTSHFEKPAIRQLALEKILSNGPKFTPLLIAHLRGYYADRALVYLRDNDPPDPAALAEPIRDGFRMSAQHVRELIQTESSVHRDDFTYESETNLAVAGKYSKYADYVPSIREFRAALDQTRTNGEKVELDCRAIVDAWLAHKHSK